MIKSCFQIFGIFFGRPSIVFTSEVFVSDTHIRKSTKGCKSILGIVFFTHTLTLSNFTLTLCGKVCLLDTSQCSILIQICNISIHIRANLAVSENWSCRTSNEIWELLHNRNSKNMDCFNADGFCERIVWDNGLFLSKQLLLRGATCSNWTKHSMWNKERDKDELWKQYIDKKSYTIIEMWECKWWKLYNTDLSLVKHLRKSFPYKRPSGQNQILDKIISGALFSYVQCDIKVLEHLPRKYSANFSQIF